MNTTTRANIFVRLQKGDRDSSWESFIETTHALRGIDVEIVSGFCALHPETQINGNFCAACDDHMRYIAEQAIQYAWGNTSNRLSCDRLDHSHECACPLGHDCNEFCEERQRVIKMAEAHGGEAGPNPFMVLAAEAMPTELQRVYVRLGKLEEENAALKAVLRAVLDVLPKESREALGSSEVLQRAEG